MAKMVGKSQWLKSVLIPFWILQLLFMVFLIGTLAYFVQYSLVASELVIMIISCVCIILNITEIILFVKHILQPITYLVFQCCKTAMWLIIFLIVIVDIERNQQAPGSSTSASTLFLDGTIEAIVLLVTFIATLIYASVVYHRHRVAKKHQLNITPVDHERYDRFYNGPYSENGITGADYHDPSSPSFKDTAGSPTALGESLTAHDHKEHPLKHGAREDRQTELPSTERQELPAEGAIHELASTRSVLIGKSEAHELASMKSVKSLKPKGQSKRSKGSPVEVFAPFE